MLIVFIVITIGLFILGCWLDEDSGFMLGVIAGFMFIAEIIVVVFLSVSVSNLKVIDQRIEMYQEENTRIEERLSVVVKQYQEYESGIFTEVSPESSITLVSLYPDLKADALVQSQIDVYVKNNETIKELKDKKITRSVKRWWLYFGN